MPSIGFGLGSPMGRLSAQDMGVPDYVKALSAGMDVGAKPALLQSKMNESAAASQKNLMMSKLFQSLMQGGGGFGGDVSGGEGGQPNNFRAAAIKALTGIDPFLMSPQQEQDMKIKGQTEAAAKKSNLTTGSNDVVREYLQNKVVMPKEYMGAFGSMSIIKDRIMAAHGDKDAKERLIQAGVAIKSVPEYAGSQLLSLGQKSTVSGLKHQGEAIKQGWPKAASFISENLTPEMQEEVNNRFNNTIKGVNRTREQFLESGGVRANPESAPKTDARKLNSESKYSWGDINHTAEKNGITVDEVLARLAKKENMNVDQLMPLIRDGE